MSSMLKREWLSKKLKEDDVKARDVRKEAKKDVNNANKKAKASQPKERSRSSKCCSVCNKTSDAMYVDYKIILLLAFRYNFYLIGYGVRGST